MMPDPPPAIALMEELGAQKGVRIRAAEPLAKHTTFRIGGPAELYVEVDGERALRRLLPALSRAGRPVQLMGLGSNVLVPDDGLSGVVLRLTGRFMRCRVWDTRVTAGAGMSLAALARSMAERGLVGIEALTGFPSTVGGAVWMNAGCYGVEIRDVFVAATVVDRQGSRQRIDLEALAPGYRSTRLQGSDLIVTSATLQLQRGDAAAALARIRELNARRRESLPAGRTAGSVFKNPPGDYAGRLIEACGLKGVSRGGAQISPRHANVIVNRGEASAEEVLGLMRLAHDEVWRRFGIQLQPEIVMVGGLRERWRRATEAYRNEHVPGGRR